MSLVGEREKIQIFQLQSLYSTTGINFVNWTPFCYPNLVCFLIFPLAESQTFLWIKLQAVEKSDLENHGAQCGDRCV